MSKKKIDVCPNCHRDYRKSDYWPVLYKCKRCGKIICNSCFNCMKCRDEDYREIIQHSELKPELKKRAEEQARKEQEARQRAAIEKIKNSDYGGDFMVDYRLRRLYGADWDD